MEEENKMNEQNNINKVNANEDNVVNAWEQATIAPETPATSATEASSDIELVDFGEDEFKSEAPEVNDISTSDNPTSSGVNMNIATEVEETKVKAKPSQKVIDDSEYDKKVLVIWFVIFVIIGTIWFGPKVISNFTSNDENLLAGDNIEKTEEKVEEETIESDVILTCVSETEFMVNKLINIYKADEKTLKSVTIEMQMINIPEDQLIMYENMISSLEVYEEVPEENPINIEGYTLTSKLEGNEYTSTTTVDLEKIPSGIVEISETETITIDILSLKDAIENGQEQGYTCSVSN